MPVRKRENRATGFYKKNILFCMFFLGVLLFVFAAERPGHSADSHYSLVDPINGTNSSQAVPDWVKASTYEYSAKGKVDPFIPFIKKQEKVQPINKPRRKKPRTPLERVEVTQLKLIGIIWGEEMLGDPLAMVQLPDGKGFILRKGTSVGRNDGKVVAVNPDSIVVREEFVDIFGVNQQRNIDLKLHSGTKEDEQS